MGSILFRLITIVFFAAQSGCALFSSTEEQQPAVTAKAETHEVEKNQQNDGVK
jgi:hypothetical protein